MATQRVALVTGASSGIGLATVRSLAEQGLAVFGVARSEDTLDRELGAIPGDVRWAAGDVTVQRDVVRVVQACMDAFGEIHVLVNNAGRSGGAQVAELDDDLWEAMLATNLTSVMRMTREVLRQGNLASADGRIINVASTAGKQGVIYASPYCASKHAVIGFTRAVALELAGRGITVNAVCPGYVETPLAQKVRSGYAKHWGKTEDEILRDFSSKIPLGRYSTPEEVASMISYLTGPLAASVTGQALNVCGGLGRF